MNKRSSIFRVTGAQEERKTLRQSSADDVHLRARFQSEARSQAESGMQYGSKKKMEPTEGQESLMDKCMLSWPNKFSVEQIKKLQSYVWSFGQNSKGELSIAHYNEAVMPERIRGLPVGQKVIDISSGAKHTGVVSENGQLWMCGSNLHDKLGLEGITVGSKKTFKPVSLLSHVRVKQVACGDYHTMCLTYEGQVYVWGGSLHNKRGDRSEERKDTQKYKPVLLKALESRRIVQIDCGDFHSVALDDTGAIYSWGLGEKGECGHGKFEDIEVPTKIKFFQNKKVTQLAVGNHHTLALTSNHELYAWGDGRYGQCGYGEYENTSIPQLVSFPQINAINNSSGNGSGSMQNNPNQTNHYSDDSVQQDILDFFTKGEPLQIKQISGGEMHSLVLTQNGKVFSFGYNAQGQLGHNNTENYCRPKLVEAILQHKVMMIACGRNHSLILNSKGDVYGCGGGQVGQLGLPDKESRKSFTHILSLMSVNVNKIYAGGFHSWVILDEMFPKKEEFSGLKGSQSADEDSLLNSDEEDYDGQVDVKMVDQSENSQYYGQELKKFVIQVNYTDTQLSHRFIRFEVPELNLELCKTKVEEFIRLIYKEESGTVYHRLQEDSDIMGERNQVLSSSKGKVGKFLTLCLVCDTSKNDDPAETRRELIKNDYSFIDQIYDIYLRRTMAVVGQAPTKTSIGLQVFIREQDLILNEYERKLGQWAQMFNKIMQSQVAHGTRIKYFELRPYSLSSSQFLMKLFDDFLLQKEQPHPINQDLVDDITKKTNKWKPKDPELNHLKNLSSQQLTGLLGTRIQAPIGGMSPPQENALLPDSFDPRDKWPKCVHQIRNQEKCGSCWAFAASEAFSDRVCIESQLLVDEIFSPQDMIECDKDNYGCQGGYLKLAWEYIEKEGVVSDECLPYISGQGKVTQCRSECQNSTLSYKKIKCKEGSVVEATSKDQIQTQLLLHGPMETGFSVYQDFFNYESGIYHHVSGQLAGGHAVKMIGWGKDPISGDGYWICANSWGPEWGESGFFKILEKEGGIDESVWACTPDVISLVVE